jgi:hypothetical protein
MTDGLDYTRWQQSTSLEVFQLLYHTLQLLAFGRLRVLSLVGAEISLTTVTQIGYYAAAL